MRDEGSIKSDVFSFLPPSLEEKNERGRDERNKIKGLTVINSLARRARAGQRETLRRRPNLVALCVFAF